MKEKIGLVLGSFHKSQVEKMAQKARHVAEGLGLKIESEIWVPGSFEKPLALRWLLDNPSISGAVALGIIERGETKHGLVMGHTVFQAIVQLEMEYLKPIGLGILGPEIESHQIEKRLEPYAEKAVLAVYTMLKIKKDIYEKEE